MTDKQPEALRLADELDCRGMNRPSWKDQFDAGYELRRLHEVNAELVGAIANLINVKGRHNTEIAYQRLVAAYDKATGENND